MHIRAQQDSAAPDNRSLRKASKAANDSHQKSPPNSIIAVCNRLEMSSTLKVPNGTFSCVIDTTTVIGENYDVSIFNIF